MVPQYTAIPPNLKLLQSIQTTTVKVAFKALRTYPSLSLGAEADKPPLSYHYLILTENFLVTIAQHPQLLFLSNALNPQNSLFPRLPSPLGEHLKPYPLQPPLSWLASPPNTHLDLVEIPRTSYSIYKRHILNIKSSEFSTHLLCFTDGSKSGPRTGCIYPIQGKILSHRIRNSVSIFTAELTAIFACLSQLVLLPLPPNILLLINTLIFFSLLALQDVHSSNLIEQRIYIILLLTLSSTSSTVTFLLILGHIDLPHYDANSLYISLRSLTLYLPPLIISRYTMVLLFEIPGVNSGHLNL